MSVLKLLLIPILLLTSTIIIIYTVLLQHPSSHPNKLFLFLSITIFNTLVIDISKDQLQTIVYYPVTNLVFLVSFTMACVLGKLWKMWPVVQICAIGFYVGHEQYRVRQIFYVSVQAYRGDEESIGRVLGIVLMLIIGQMGLCAGLGILINILIQGFEPTQNNTQNILQSPQWQQIATLIPTPSSKHIRPQLPSSIPPLQITPNLAQLIKSLFIFLPPLFYICSLIYQLFTEDTQNHTHSHQHDHVYFTSQSSSSVFFHDQNDISGLGLLAIAGRIVSSGVIFHFGFGVWNRVLGGLETEEMRDRFRVGLVAVAVVMCRLLAEWL